MKPEAYWRDYTGRFEQRPYYSENAIEAGAEEFLRAFLGERFSWPISDEDLDFVADMSASFDRGRDVDSLGVDVDAVTVFSASGRPRIVLNKALKAGNMRLRRRMTIAHELGHVVLHQPMYQRPERQLDLLYEYRATPSYCHDAMSTASVDWCEWQANYFGGALLAPKRELLNIAARVLGEHQFAKDGSRNARAVIDEAARSLDISREAARVRLAQVGIIAPSADQTTFSSQSA